MGEGKKVARKEEGTKEIRSHHSHISADSLFIEGRTDGGRHFRCRFSSLSSSLVLSLLFCLYCPLIPEPFSARFTPNTESATQKRHDEMKRREVREASDSGVTCWLEGSGMKDERGIALPSYAVRSSSSLQGDQSL